MEQKKCSNDSFMHIFFHLFLSFPFSCHFSFGNPFHPHSFRFLKSICHFCYYTNFRTKQRFRKVANMQMIYSFFFRSHIFRTCLRFQGSSASDTHTHTRTIKIMMHFEKRKCNIIWLSHALRMNCECAMMI